MSVGCRGFAVGKVIRSFNSFWCGRQRFELLFVALLSCTMPLRPVVASCPVYLLVSISCKALTALGVAASVSDSLFVALLSCTVPFAVSEADGTPVI